MLDYDELNSLLRLLQSDACAADCHGFLCGHICVNDFPASSIWIDYLDVQSDDEELISGCSEDIDSLVKETINQFESLELDFHPLLPGDDSPIEDRVAALSEWCHGFLNGFAQGEAADQALDDADSRELIENFSRICRLEVGDKPDEGDERALLELVEYVRMGAIFIYSNASLQASGGSGVYH